MASAQGHDEVAAKVSAGAAACDELTEVHMALGRSVSSSPWGSLHRTMHNMAPSGASDEREREREQAKETVPKIEVAAIHELFS